MDAKWHKIEQKQLDVSYKLLFTEQEAIDYYQQLEKEIVYLSSAESVVRVFGKVHPIPRQQVAHGDENIFYMYSGTTIKAKPWTPLLSKLRECVESACECNFNFVLVNKYATGRQYIGPHRDSGKNMDAFSPIASLSFGATRDFLLRHRGDKSEPPVRLSLNKGTLLVMDYPTNKYWQHSVPVMRNCSEPRINLTFRQLTETV